jgi:hypothetical protein
MSGGCPVCCEPMSAREPHVCSGVEPEPVHVRCDERAPDCSCPECTLVGAALDAVRPNAPHVPRPADAPPRRNGGIVCDMDRGPCACGAWHVGPGPAVDHARGREADPEAFDGARLYALATMRHPRVHAVPLLPTDPALEARADALLARYEPGAGRRLADRLHLAAPLLDCVGGLVEAADEIARLQRVERERDELRETIAHAIEQNRAAVAARDEATARVAELEREGLELREAVRAYLASDGTYGPRDVAGSIAARTRIRTLLAAKATEDEQARALLAGRGEGGDDGE